MVDVPGDKFDMAALGQESDQDLAAKVYKIMSNMLNFVGLPTKEDINRIDVRIDKLDAKIDKVEAGLRAEISKVDAGLRAEISKVDAKIDRVEAALRSEINKVDKKIDKVEEKVDKLGIRIWQAGAAIVTAFTLIAKFFMHM
jgi:polyhydroxyalkanoate synthesis regulator phasin